MDTIPEIAKKIYEIIGNNKIKLTKKGNFPLKIMEKLVGKKVSEDKDLFVKLTKELMLKSDLLKVEKNYIFVNKKVTNLDNVLLNTFKDRFVLDIKKGIIFYEEPFILRIIYNINENGGKISLDEVLNIIFIYKIENDVYELLLFEIFELFFIGFGYLEKNNNIYKITNKYKELPKVKKQIFERITSYKDFEKYKDIDIVKEFVYLIENSINNKKLDLDIDPKILEYRAALNDLISRLFEADTEKELDDIYNIFIKGFTNHYKKDFNINKFYYIFEVIEEIISKKEPSSDIQKDIEMLIAVYFSLKLMKKKEAKKHVHNFFTSLFMVFIELLGYYIFEEEI